MRVSDITGRRFARLVVLSRDGSMRGKSAWRCECDCGNTIRVPAGALNSGNTKSCGCLQSERTSEAKRKHGGCAAPEYGVWMNMRGRCGNKRNKAYHNYGGRGIRVCERWSDFAAFLADMGPRPSDKHSIERTNNDGPYSPDNCVWATKEIQSSNRRTNHVVEFQGRRLNLKQWSEETGIPSFTIRARLRLGWSAEEALSTPVRKRLRA